MEFKEAVEKYQCPGCIVGGDISCYESNDLGGIGCGKHMAGTIISHIGTILLGMPIGFCRLGSNTKLKPNIYQKFEDCSWYNGKYNLPVWKYLTKDGHTLVRGLSPRTNSTFIHIFLENCLDKINCLEISEEDIEYMN